MSSKTSSKLASSGTGRSKFLIGGLLILAAVVYLIISSTAVGAQFFFTVDELLLRGPDAVGKPARIAGAVLGDSIRYDSDTLTLSFTIVHTPADTQLINDEGGLAAALDTAVADPSRNRLEIVYIGVKPDLLRHAAEAHCVRRVRRRRRLPCERALASLPDPLRRSPTRPGRRLRWYWRVKTRAQRLSP